MSVLDDLRAKFPGLARRADAGSALAAIRLFCLHCMGGSSREVSDCSATDCPLWSRRLGRRPIAGDGFDAPESAGGGSASKSEGAPTEPATRAPARSKP